MLMIGVSTIALAVMYRNQKQQTSLAQEAEADLAQGHARVAAALEDRVEGPRAAGGDDDARAALEDRARPLPPHA